ncbi:YeeE/YedE thiosulfate transporter family protein [Dethiosulfatarculus sandiegensis]|uniref:Membrane protein n=1 Tax=Dethiosulfatarculus sandiegensis TaxID=1429043 RepID=A0A0D2GJL6_9BACT|nr:YeeE/YedE thiosulfate transporter family protein [Dethiosulfatarculus sandiegensis]KIX14962.1 membrane protein [Dethiosulfatarculus sandiegensis]
MNFILAVFLGTLFGFVLQRVGAADPVKIVGMLRLRDMHLAKAIFTGIGLSSTVLFLLLWLGVISPGHLSVKALYWGVIPGGVLLGAGWALAGFCPGTGVVAAGSGRKDAWFFVLGGLFGAGLYTMMYGSLKDTWLMHNLLGGKATLVLTGKSVPLIDTPWSPVLAIALGIIFLLAAKFLPDKLR